MLLIIERGIRGGICHSIYGYSKGNIKYTKDYDKIKNRHIFSTGMKIIYTVGQCRKSLK